MARSGEMEGETSIFLYPGVPFLKTGAMLTNFHLPRTSLLLLVCAFGGTESDSRRLPPRGGGAATASTPTAIAC